jgi:hypothetical protein
MIVKAKVEINVTPELLGAWFSDLDDDAQARFFVAAAEAAKAWGPGWTEQFYAAGTHLRTCKCATEDARELVREIANGLHHGTHA